MCVVPRMGHWPPRGRVVSGSRGSRLVGSVKAVAEVSRAAPVGWGRGGESRKLTTCAAVSSDQPVLGLCSGKLAERRRSSGQSEPPKGVQVKVGDPLTK